jgi:hypothetical protein
VTLAKRLLAASERLPTWVRVASIVALPLLAFATNASLGTPWLAPLFVAFVALTLFALFAHAPVFAWDGPLPFSDQGIHLAGEVHPWTQVTAIRPADGRNLEAVLADGQTLRLRVRGNRTWDDLRAAVARHKPQAVQF